MIEIQVAASDQDERLDRFLVRCANDLSRARIQDLIDQGLAKVEGLVAKPSRRLRVGQTVTLIVPPIKPSDLTPDPSVNFDILFQDHHIIIINKPAGLVVHPAAGHYEGTLVHGLLAACPDVEGVGAEARPGIVHRLDKDTSGIMVAAKTDLAHRALIEAFKGREVKKYYLALCLRQPPANHGFVNAPIGRHPFKRQQMSINSRAGREAVTEYELLCRYPLGVSLVGLHLHTGRTHQIRVHLASIGCPILGDRVYGKGTAHLTDLGPLKWSVPRQMLHSFRLAFRHPITFQDLEFEAAWPADMQTLICALKNAKDREYQDDL
ncbi:MAG: RluA family pseudouridine synthase [Deltaproteobacteria bacterium]|nr:RluA family pseudouridine synthase [Deltaproteobacteria bacterium]